MSFEPAAKDYRIILRSTNASDKELALLALLNSKERYKYINEIAACAADNDNNVRSAAIKVLAKIKRKQVIKYLLSALNDKKIEIAIDAAIALASWRMSQAIPILISIIKEDYEDHSIHKRTIEALGEYNKERLLGILKIALYHRRKASRLKAIQAIKRYKSKKARKILQEAIKTERDPQVLEILCGLF